MHFDLRVNVLISKRNTLHFFISTREQIPRSSLSFQFSIQFSFKACSRWSVPSAILKKRNIFWCGVKKNSIVCSRGKKKHFVRCRKKKHCSLVKKNTVRCYLPLIGVTSPVSRDRYYKKQKKKNIFVRCGKKKTICALLCWSFYLPLIGVSFVILLYNFIYFYFYYVFT